ncbi:predicted protein [Uncinocarpus reesii 1704]|uniref:Aminoglycoside phosphotransferase domain-containing protein n=1 Tax=Uncinocarpus reesii (strain UAMH 1704) TaxID=336963 RepID=C4JZW9_UNCRE|nr:uncharacterized protein UREG_07720 [Uncinocarpus reesii 1704]EEP82855.1 predicted protein [Uncinocarpus reesii 1704]
MRLLTFLLRIPTPEVRRTKSAPKSYVCDVEMANLRKLAELGCTCTPKVLDTSFYVQHEQDPVPGGFAAICVLEKLPGHDLSNFGDLPMSERDQVRLAFAKSIREFYSFGFEHRDEARRNLIWDRVNQKCYIIDLEDAYQIENPDEYKKFIPELHWRSWQIAGPGKNCSLYGWDPMVPYGQPYIKDPSDEMLEKMAIEAAGKEVHFPRRDPWRVVKVSCA